MVSLRFGEFGGFGLDVFDAGGQTVHDMGFLVGACHCGLRIVTRGLIDLVGGIGLKGIEKKRRWRKMSGAQEQRKIMIMQFGEIIVRLGVCHESRPLRPETWQCGTCPTFRTLRYRMNKGLGRAGMTQSSTLRSEKLPASVRPYRPDLNFFVFNFFLRFVDGTSKGREDISILYVLAAWTSQ